MWGKLLFGVTLYARVLIIAQGRPVIETDCSEDSQGYRFCESENAICKSDPDDPQKFRCMCPEGTVKIDGLCKDEAEQTGVTRTALFTESTSLSPTLSSPVSSTTDVESTLRKIFDTSSQTSYFASTTDVEHTSETLDDSSETSNFAFATSQPGEISATSSVPFSGTLDWPMSAKLSTASLACIIVILSSLLAFLLYRYLKIRKSQQLEGNEVVFRKGNKDLHSDSVREPIESGVVVVSYVFPCKRLSKLSSVFRSSPC